MVNKDVYLSVWVIFYIFQSASASVPGTSDNLGELVIEWLSMGFSPLASSAVEAVKETKFGTKVA